VALETASREKALELAERLIPVTPWMKVGLELFSAAGPEVVARLKDMGARVFLDLKFHDIPSTVGRAVAAAVLAGADMCNVHILGGEAMCRAAAESARRAREGGRGCLALGVTVLTSMDGAADTLQAAGPGGLEALVADYACRARAWGLHGVVCSGREAAAVKKAAGPDTLCLCPGIRPPGADRDDQRRVCSPLDAARAGADFLVVGRPITGAARPEAAAGEIIASYMQEAP
jgi:orotidine-5'-phosphate decarboxylase